MNAGGLHENDLLHRIIVSSEWSVRERTISTRPVQCACQIHFNNMLFLMVQHNE